MGGGWGGAEISATRVNKIMHLNVFRLSELGQLRTQSKSLSISGVTVKSS